MIYDDHLKIVYMSAWSTYRQDGTIKVRYTLPMEVVMVLSSGYEDVLRRFRYVPLPICRLVYAIIRIMAGALSRQSLPVARLI